jgi:hypothetical protein
MVRTVGEFACGLVDARPLSGEPGYHLGQVVGVFVHFLSPMFLRPGLKVSDNARP